MRTLIGGRDNRDAGSGSGSPFPVTQPSMAPCGSGFISSWLPCWQPLAAAFPGGLRIRVRSSIQESPSSIGWKSIAGISWLTGLKESRSESKPRKRYVILAPTVSQFWLACSRPDTPHGRTRPTSCSANSRLPQFDSPKPMKRTEWPFRVSSCWGQMPHLPCQR